MLLTMFFPLISFVLSLFPPILYLPTGIYEAGKFFISVVGYINIFIPVMRIVPILALIMFIRNIHILSSLVRFVLRFVPGITGGN